MTNLLKLDSLAEPEHIEERDDHGERKRPQKPHDGFSTSVMGLQPVETNSDSSAIPILAEFEERTKCANPSKTTLLRSLHSGLPP